MVTPLAGVWVEIPVHQKPWNLFRVTPLAGVWVEIISVHLVSLCGLVTPLAGVWVEIQTIMGATRKRVSHSPCGSVG